MYLLFFILMNDRDLRSSSTVSVNGERARHAKAPFQRTQRCSRSPGHVSRAFLLVRARISTRPTSCAPVCSRSVRLLFLTAEPAAQLLSPHPLPHAIQFQLWHWMGCLQCGQVWMPPLSGTSTASTAATHFTLALTLEDDVNDTSPPSELTVALNAKKNDTFPENVLTRRDCHLVVQPRGLLHPPQLLPSPACRPRSDCMLWSPTVTLSLRMCSDIRSVNRSMSRSCRTAKEWPVQFWRVRYFYLVC
jgi:hypothetical protein